MSKYGEPSVYEQREVYKSCSDPQLGTSRQIKLDIHFFQKKTFQINVSIDLQFKFPFNVPTKRFQTEQCCFYVMWRADLSSLSQCASHGRWQGSVL